MKELFEKIDKAIEKKAMKTGAMGTETVSVQLDLTDEEKEIFLNENKCDEHYYWEFDGNTLSIDYTEDL